MRIGTVTSAAVAAAVWTQATRTLTAFTNCVVEGGIAQTSIAALAAVNAFAAVGNIATQMYNLKTGNTSTATSVIQINDGTFVQLTDTAASGGGTATRLAVVSHSFGLRLLNNDAAQASTYMVTGFEFVF